jgi:hypothetical protein
VCLLCIDPGSATVIEQNTIDLAVARLEVWIETLRGPAGALPYGGPVAHWWQQSLLYTGPGFDWRYEGIIFGYLNLWKHTNEPCWLAKARRAGEDLLFSQFPGGHFPFSAFESNPASGGTPHEAAASLGLLELAKALRTANQPDWELYQDAAIRNLRAYYLEKLWDPLARAFRDHPQIASFVPNKAATACQAFFLWSELSGDERWADEYALPNLERILAYQVSSQGTLKGAIAQNSLESRLVPRYMPFYIARCVPGLVQGYAWSGQEHFLTGASLAMDFVLKQRSPNGLLLPVVYPGGQAHYWPQWVAALGDILLASEMLLPYGFQYDLEELRDCFLSGQDSSGGFQTAIGFASQANGKAEKIPEFRDLLHVAGWCDKAFHWLTNHVSDNTLPAVSCQPFKADCVFLGRNLTFYEDDERVQVTQARKTVYLWIKGETWAREAVPEFWLH